MLVDLAQALQERDSYTGAHSLRVASLAEAVGRRLGWDDHRLTLLRLGALLHDVGKLTLPRALLTKPGPLEPSELARIRAHPVDGARIVAPIAPGRIALSCVLYHHERWDGSGYPVGRNRERIPVEARVLAVVDAFDAMTSARPYRRPLSAAAALAEVERCAGSQFDPEVARALVDACEAGEVAVTLAVA